MIKNRIKEYRAKYNMKQEDLAKLVGVRRETIGNLEKGRYNPSLVLAWNIAKVFNASIEDIFYCRELNIGRHRWHHRAENLERGFLLFLCPDARKKGNVTGRKSTFRRDVYLKIVRVFPRRTKATPDDPLAFTGPPPKGGLPDIKEVHVSVAFTYDMEKACQLAEQWMKLGVLSTWAVLPSICLAVTSCRGCI